MKRKKSEGILEIVIIVFLVVGLSTFLFFFRGCNALSEDSQQDIYRLSEEDGFIKKANALLERALANGDASIHPASIEELNKKYPALIFDMPYGSDTDSRNASRDYIEGQRIEDIRLVDINPDKLNAEDKKLYYNSRLPELLKEQKTHIENRMFKIMPKFYKIKNYRLRDSVSVFKIDSIKMIPELFKVPLEKKIWQGTIKGTESSLFPDSAYCFLSWGKNVLPIKEMGDGMFNGFNEIYSNQITINTNISNGNVTFESFESGSTNREMFDLYDLYAKAYKGGRTVIKLVVNDEVNTSFSIANLVDSICIKSETHYFEIFEYLVDGNKEIKGKPMFSAASKETKVSFRSDLKIVVYKDEKYQDRFTEFVITHTNPLLLFSTLQWTNAGQQRYNIDKDLTDRFSQQLITGINATMNFDDTISNVNLSIDPLLSLELQKEMKKYYVEYIKRLPVMCFDDDFEMSVTVMDMSNGNIIAAPYYRSEDERSHISYDIAIARKSPALESRPIGSTFKPLVALSAVLNKQSLIGLDTRGHYKLGTENDRTRTDKAIFYGCEISSWCKNLKYQWDNGCADMKTFFAKSDDVYPVALVALSMDNKEIEDAYSGTFDNSELFIAKQNMRLNPNKNASDINFIERHSELYDLPYYRRGEDPDLRDAHYMNVYIWSGLYGWNVSRESTESPRNDKFTLDIVTPTESYINFDCIRKEKSLRGGLQPWVLGQGVNDWNCFKLAEAYCRLLTKRRIKASLIQRNTTFDLLDGDKDTWNDLLVALHEAQSMNIGLLRPMNNHVNRLNVEYNMVDDTRLLLYSKTGTPQNYSRKEYKTIDGIKLWYDIGIYCMALMPQSSVNRVSNNNSAKGVMVVIQVVRKTKHDPKETTGLESKYARNFFSEINGDLVQKEKSYARFKKFYEMTKKYY